MGTASAKLSLVIVATLAVVGCERTEESSLARRDVRPDSARVGAARPHLEDAAKMAGDVVDGRRRCDLAIPGYVGCEHDHQQVLALAAGNFGGAGSRADALLWVPPQRRPALAMTLWHFDSVGAPLGHGWYHVTAISHVN
jgi:hypothetical protein